MQTLKKVCAYLFLSSLILGNAPSFGQASQPKPASLQVMILDENGSLVHSAHIYIFSRNKKEFFGTREAHGRSSFDLPAGDYRVYAAYTVANQGVTDHYSTPEAFVHVSAGDPSSVILSMQKANDSQLYLSDTARQKLGIDEELAKYLN